MPGLITPPLSLYVHFPWCVRKCPYCDFNSHTLNGELPQERYVEALERDMEAQAAHVRGRRLISIFLGGGTPSLFAPAAIERVLAAARREFSTTEPIEITLEANPGTIERGRFAEYAAAGINRVSLGAQSFDARALQALGRIHSPQDTIRAAEELHAAGLANFNLDLMYALPGQTTAGAVDDLGQALALAPAHLSHYQLTIEPGTVFAAAPPTLPVEDTAAAMLMKCRRRLQDAGFSHYEVSAYARAGLRCQHNLNYWTFGDYLGVGAGAHGKITSASHGTIIRTAHLREPRRYLSSDPRTLERKPVAAADLPFEFMLNALRLGDGFDTETFEGRTGLSWESIRVTMQRLEARGLVASEGNWHRPTLRGMQFLNDVLLAFLPEKPLTPQVSTLSMHS
jgi:putative oxygen-independent coproporphyrinogen III oxidase